MQFCCYSDNGENNGDFYFYSDCQIQFLAQSLACKSWKFCQTVYKSDISVWDSFQEKKLSK